MREAWFSHNGTMPLFLLLIVGIFLFCQFTIPFEQLSYALALRHLGGEAVGCHHGSVVLAMRLKEFLRHERRVVRSASEESGYRARASSIAWALCSIFAFCSAVGVGQGKLLYTTSLL